MQLNNSILYNSRITKINFRLSGTQSNIDDSYVNINTHELFRDNKPIEGGLFDPHLGTVDHAYNCATCGNNKRLCPGHEGSITLKYPVYNPLMLTDMKKWLRVVCFVCGNIVVPAKVYADLPKNTRLMLLSKQIKTQESNSTVNKLCTTCGNKHPFVSNEKKEPLVMFSTIHDGKNTKKEKLYPHNVMEIFSRISDETVISLGRDPRTHPRDYVISVVKVPSVIVRPDNKKPGKVSDEADLTSILINFIKKNNLMTEVTPNTDITPKIEKDIYELNSIYKEFVKSNSTDTSKKSLSSRIKSKTGLVRKNMLGKRVGYMCRSTITGDPTLKIDEVGMPQIFCKKSQIGEVVQDYNKKRLYTYVANGTKHYPGCTKLKKAATGETYYIGGNKDILLENGDILYRDRITGDITSFNRQPSLKISNISGHKIVVNENPNDLTLRMNVTACSFNC